MEAPYAFADLTDDDDLAVAIVTSLATIADEHVRLWERLEERDFDS